MENNKLLIGAQFTDYNARGDLKSNHIELYVVRDITLRQLIDGIGYGLKKMAAQDTYAPEMYQKCRSVFQKCIVETDAEGYYSKITLTSYNAASAQRLTNIDGRVFFCEKNLSESICDLGFITSTRLIFDVTGKLKPDGEHDTQFVIPAFDPKRSEDIFFPRYNISTRQLYQFDSTPVALIPPAEPPKKPNQSVAGMLLAALLPVSILLIARIATMSNTNGQTMIVLSVAMGISSVVMAVLNYGKQRKDYKNDLRDWRTHYEAYINHVVDGIQNRQTKDVKTMDRLYPDMSTLINKDQIGIFSLNDHLYSRSPGDEDFLTFRIGTSDQVLSKFDINGSIRETVFSEAVFSVTPDALGKERIHIELKNQEGGNRFGQALRRLFGRFGLKNDSQKTEDQPRCNREENGQIFQELFELPTYIQKSYRYLHRAPLLYSLKNKGALGIVDKNMKNKESAGQYAVSRMIFELCYYHSPDDLQFIVFFNEEKGQENIERACFPYKFMPHFHGLFSDRSQFAFDYASASQILSSLLTIMNDRGDMEEEKKTVLPHIVFIVFSEHGLKEHAFAEYLPKAPMNGQPFVNDIGLTFVYAVTQKEYLPGYCDDVIFLSESNMKLIPRFSVAEAQEFQHLQIDGKQFYLRVANAYKFFSAVYYARIAENSKIPSSVSLFDLYKTDEKRAGIIDEKAAEEMVLNNWGVGGRTSASSVTKSLKVPIGKTDTGIAYLDLHENADGPHMLVAGTTGSGKTETVITYLLGLCAIFRPDQLNLLLVDMKGGGFTKRLGKLPHVVGAVTDVDGDENGTSEEYMLRRFLSAMKAEIKRRKILFNALLVDNIDAYIRACADINSHIAEKKITDSNVMKRMKEKAKNDPLSHLILVVDEFSELKRFSRDNDSINFIDEITTIARVGRSLGFHIILISQNIEGAITEDISVNSKARLCLKVATKQASKEMIGTELAASPFMPGNGRAYLLIGTGSRFEYFQSGYSGMGMKEEGKVEIILARKYGPYTCFYRSDKDNEELSNQKKEEERAGTRKTQIDAFVEAICTSYEKFSGEIRPPHIVFTQPLPEKIFLDENNAVRSVEKKG